MKGASEGKETSWTAGGQERLLRKGRAEQSEVEEPAMGSVLSESSLSSALGSAW